MISLYGAPGGGTGGDRRPGSGSGSRPNVQASMYMNSVIQGQSRLIGTTSMEMAKASESKAVAVPITPVQLQQKTVMVVASLMQIMIYCVIVCQSMSALDSPLIDSFLLTKSGVRESISAKRLHLLPNVILRSVVIGLAFVGTAGQIVCGICSSMSHLSKDSVLQSRQLQLHGAMYFVVNVAMMVIALATSIIPWQSYMASRAYDWTHGGEPALDHLTAALVGSSLEASKHHRMTELLAGIQQKYQCCGLSGKGDWLYGKFYLPESTLSILNNKFYTPKSGGRLSQVDLHSETADYKWLCDSLRGRNGFSQVPSSCCVRAYYGKCHDRSREFCAKAPPIIRENTPCCINNKKNKRSNGGLTCSFRKMGDQTHTELYRALGKACQLPKSKNNRAAELESIELFRTLRPSIIVEWENAFESDPDYPDMGRLDTPLADFNDTDGQDNPNRYKTDCLAVRALGGGQEAVIQSHGSQMLQMALVLGVILPVVAFVSSLVVFLVTRKAVAEKDEDEQNKPIN